MWISIEWTHFAVKVIDYHRAHSNWYRSEICCAHYRVLCSTANINCFHSWRATKKGEKKDESDRKKHWTWLRPTSVQECLFDIIWFYLNRRGKMDWPQAKMGLWRVTHTHNKSLNVESLLNFKKINKAARLGTSLVIAVFVFNFIFCLIFLSFSFTSERIMS